MEYLDIAVESLHKLGAFHTAKEISGQPELWLAVFDSLQKQQYEIDSFINESLKESNKIILTGAGTSAYIGLSLKGAFFRNLKIDTQAVATTDFVSHPLDYINEGEKILMVSFARSGNSPESVAAVELADKLAGTCRHLVVTCDSNGELARYQSLSKKYVFTLPAEANDKSLAMTGSYSGMLLAGFLIAGIGHLQIMKPKVDIICSYGNKILSEYLKNIQMVAKLDFERALFLGSGPLFGTATESHLKLQELTDGNIICKNESYLGLRHGPKAVIDNDTIIIFLLSNNPYVNKYESDLVRAISKGKKPLCQVAVCETEPENLKFDLLVKLSDNGVNIDEELLTVCNIIPGQLLGFYKSLELGLSPDNPSVSGSISRVVEGVKIYPFTK